MESALEIQKLMRTYNSKQRTQMILEKKQEKKFKKNKREKRRKRH